MTYRLKDATYALLLLTSLFAATNAIADNCGYGSANPTNPLCPPGTPVYSQLQQAQAQRDAELRNSMEQSAAAADPRNQQNPNSPYYLGTPAQQCEAAKHSLFCSLGIACPPPPYIDCARVGQKPAPVHHHRHHHY